MQAPFERLASASSPCEEADSHATRCASRDRAAPTVESTRHSVTVESSSRSEYSYTCGSNMVAASASIIVGVVGVLLAVSGMHTIPEGHVGLYWRGGALLSRITQAGFRWKAPLIEQSAAVQVTYVIRNCDSLCACTRAAAHSLTSLFIIIPPHALFHQ